MSENDSKHIKSKVKPTFVRIKPENKSRLKIMAFERDVPYYYIINEAIDFYLSQK